MNTITVIELDTGPVYVSDLLDRLLNATNDDNCHTAAACLAVLIAQVSSLERRIATMKKQRVLQDELDALTKELGEDY